MNHLYIVGCILFTVFGQLLGKWRMKFLGPQIPEDLSGKLNFIFSKLIWDPYIILCYLSAFIASLLWLMVVNKFQLSYAYPFMSAAFVLVLIFSIVFFKETFTFYKICGTILIVVGLVFITRES